MEVNMSQISIPGSTDQERRIRTLQSSDKSQNHATVEATVTIGKIGFWSAVLTTISSIGYAIAVMALMAASLSIQSSSQAQGWTGIEAFLATFEPIQMLPVIPSLLLAPAFTALMVCIHSYAAEEKKIWSRLGLAFTLMYATMAAINYMVQLIPVWRSISNGETDGLAMFVLGNPHSMFWGLAYAYIFMNLAMLFTAQVFVGSRLEKRLRMLFILNGVSVVFTLGWIALDSPPLYLLGSLVFWWPVFTAATVSVALLFARLTKAGR
jgi:hypothetical protein